MAAGPAVKRLLQDYSGKIQLVMKFLPHEPRPYSRLAAEAALAAWEQEKYWEMHERLIDHSPHLDRASLLRMASEAGLDIAAFTSALDAKAHAQRIDQDRKEAADLNVIATPTFFINGRRIMGTPPYALLKEMVEEELAGGP